MVDKELEKVEWDLLTDRGGKKTKRRPVGKQVDGVESSVGTLVLGALSASP